MGDVKAIVGVELETMGIKEFMSEAGYNRCDAVKESKDNGYGKLKFTTFYNDSLERDAEGYCESIWFGKKSAAKVEVGDLPKSFNDAEILPWVNADGVELLKIVLRNKSQSFDEMFS
jgi:hypothetical protein